MIIKIPEHLYSFAKASYFCNVRQFIGIGENRTIDNRQAGKVKCVYEKVEDWFDSLDEAGKADIVRFLETEFESDQAAKRFFADPYKK